VVLRHSRVSSVFQGDPDAHSGSMGPSPNAFAGQGYEHTFGGVGGANAHLVAPARQQPAAGPDHRHRRHPERNANDPRLLQLRDPSDKRHGHGIRGFRIIVNAIRFHDTAPVAPRRRRVRAYNFEFGACGRDRRRDVDRGLGAVGTHPAAEWDLDGDPNPGRFRQTST